MQYTAEQRTQANAIVAHTLCYMRKCRGIQQRELAEMLDMPQMYVCALEKGRRNVKLIEAFTYALALESSPWAVFAAVKLALEEEGLA